MSITTRFLTIFLQADAPPLDTDSLFINTSVFLVVVVMLLMLALAILALGAIKRRLDKEANQNQ